MRSYFLKHSIFTCRMLTISALAILLFSSCSKEEINNNDTVNNDNYYVKYIIKAPGPYGRFSNWTASIPAGTYSKSGYQSRSWNKTYGPVKKGFYCSVQIGD